MQPKWWDSKDTNWLNALKIKSEGEGLDQLRFNQFSGTQQQNLYIHTVYTVYLNFPKGTPEGLINY